MARAALIILLWLVPVVARAADPIAVVPYRIDYHGWFIVEARVNGQGPYDFIVDTGATQSIVFESLHALHRFPLSEEIPTLVFGLSSAGEFTTYDIGEIAVGAARLEDLSTVILPNWEIGGRSPHGVLGLDFLRQYRVVFDARRGEARFYPLTAEIPVSGWRRVPLDSSDFGLDIGVVYTLNAHVNHRTVPMLLDIGATGAIFNGAALRVIPSEDVTIRIRPSTTSQKGRVIDALDVTKVSRLVRVERFSVSGAVWRNLVFVAFDAPIFAELGVGDQPFGLFGASLLHNRSFAFDFENERMYIGPRRR